MKPPPSERLPMALQGSCLCTSYVVGIHESSQQLFEIKNRRQLSGFRDVDPIICNIRFTSEIEKFISLKRDPIQQMTTKNYLKRNQHVEFLSAGNTEDCFSLWSPWVKQRKKMDLKMSQDKLRTIKFTMAAHFQLHLFLLKSY